MNVRRLLSLGVTATVASVGVLAGAVLLAGPAGASDTVSAQLSLSGVVSEASPTGGSTVGIHPGDTVDFSASTVPTAGLNKLGIGDVLGSLLNGIAGYQVDVTFASGFGSSSNKTVTLKSTPTVDHLKITFPANGTYNFTWQAKRVGLLGNLVPIELDGNELKSAGIALNSSNQYVGKIVVAANPPAGGIAVQLPSVSASPSVPVVGQLPGVGVPGVNTPTLPNVVAGLPGGKSSSAPSGGSKPTAGTSGSNLHYTPSGETVADKTMPKGYGSGSGVGGTYVPPGLGSAINAPAKSFAGSGSGVGSASSATKTKASPAPSSVDLASSSPHSAITGLPSLLIVCAVIALSGATAMYARTYLLHHPATARIRSRG